MDEFKTLCELYGHCYCKGTTVWAEGITGGISHKVCCKCGNVQDVSNFLPVLYEVRKYENYSD